MSNDDRRTRQAAGLRANLARRKAQDRARAADDPIAATIAGENAPETDKGDASPMNTPQATIVPHLTVKDARRAMAFYQSAFGAEIVYALDIPDSGLVMHAELRILGQPVYLCDENPDIGALGPDPSRPAAVTVHLHEVDVDSLYDAALAAGGRGDMPPDDMFWGARYARLTDPFGQSWSLARHIRDVPPEELAALARAAFAQD